MGGRRPRRWYLVRLKPGGFERAKINLERQGISVFMPLQETTERRRCRLLSRYRPLFPGYLFVELDGRPEIWRVVNSTYGVATLVSLGSDGPTPVCQEVMDDLFARTTAEGVFSPTSDYVIGDRVRLISGPFARQFARIEALPERDRIYVLLDMMGQSVRTAVPRAALQHV